MLKIISTRFDQVFAYSSNVCSAKIALKENKKIFYKYLWRFGFGKKTGIDLPGEESGIVKDYVNLRPFDLATMAFGQGISVTQIQLARAYCAIANGGISYYTTCAKLYIKKPQNNNIKNTS
ncbi:Penicillin binding protein transpeptidase domain-containing protein [Desulfurella multipotens]|uniref:Penicillin binding protein transpeptidase domain-containing protein n=1 Tax=Desulfurella multipotens TaxID=79269 RepID=A0A1G6MCJ1_9BACT|nr:penicillin-binding transpeptidase domain-containing protein [Desulfurella multipotens]SDC53302.1 Penicillin binding protein transpeptidase domain-containing protein [Desulfurella multipotens]